MAILNIKARAMGNAALRWGPMEEKLMIIGTILVVWFVFMLFGDSAWTFWIGPLAFGGWLAHELSSKTQEERAHREIAFNEGRAQAVQERIREIRSGITLESFGGTNFRPQKGELVYASIPVHRRRMTTKTTGVTYGGPALRIKIAKGVYFRAAHFRGASHKTDVMESLGVGYLLVTNKRIVFNAQGHGKNWVTRWGSVIDWNASGTELTIETSRGRPSVFDLDAATNIPNDYVDTEPAVLRTIMAIASGAEEIVPIPIPNPSTIPPVLSPGGDA
jgi:hypothetical protein